ncbi:disease resistance protein Roq1-like [Arachis hypogaea]|uniref:disease resistance protein Roq1-like n=1 Tax=Arachis hypogaea TaxID=3818 RepID=UPI000DEC5CB2|nr:TMV resistance protein N-like [Arachis hypogaea]
MEAGAEEEEWKGKRKKEEEKAEKLGEVTKTASFLFPGNYMSFGLESPVLEVASLLDVESNAGVHMIKLLKQNADMTAKQNTDKTVGRKEAQTELLVLKKEFHKYKVLLVLDDIDDPEQLIAIAGKPDWFGRGSRILITTWDKHLLTLHSIEMTYEIQALNEEESLDLLNWKAFKIDIVNLRYANVLTRTVTYASVLSLTLEVIDSKLFGKYLEQ